MSEPNSAQSGPVTHMSVWLAEKYGFDLPDTWTAKECTTAIRDMKRVHREAYPRIEPPHGEETATAPL